jgi:hypothetical protein
MTGHHDPARHGPARPGRRRATGALALVVALTAAALHPLPATGAPRAAAGPAPATTISVVRPRLALHYLTRDGSDRFVLGEGPASARLDAPSTNTGSNTRAIFWAPGTANSTDQQSCATWSDSRGLNVQQGIALRVRHDTNGRWRSVTVMKNILYGAYWQFNVLTWDTARRSYGQVHGGVSLPGPFRTGETTSAPLPWKVCAKVTGSLVTLKAWRGNEAEPTWDDPSHSGRVRLPPGWTYPGKPGWYTGHIPARGTAGHTGLATTTLPG